MEDFSSICMNILQRKDGANMGNLKIVRVPIPSPTLWPHQTTNCYLIGNEKESILIDAGYNQIETKTELEKFLLLTGLAQPKAIILTHHHPDHAPGMKQLIHWDPSIYCHSLEFEEIKSIISPKNNITTLSDQETLAVDHKTIIILHTPGHTKGHISIYVPSHKTLIAGDNLVAEGTSWIGPPDGDMSDYLQSLCILKKLDISRVGPGHGEWITKPYEHIDFVINRRLQREAQIQDLLKRNGDMSSKKLTELIYQDSIHPSVFEVAKRTTEAHLIKLVKDGIVVQKENNYSLKS